MVNTWSPSINSQEKTQESYEKMVNLSSASKPLFEIWDGGGDNPLDFGPIEIEKFRDYIHVRVNQITKTYDTGKEVKTSKYFPLNKCSKEFLSDTEYEKQFYTSYIDKHFYCATDPDIYLRGTRDTQVMGLETTYLIWEVMKCTDRTKEPDDPPC